MVGFGKILELLRMLRFRQTLTHVEKIHVLVSICESQIVRNLRYVSNHSFHQYSSYTAIVKS